MLEQYKEKNLPCLLLRESEIFFAACLSNYFLVNSWKIMVVSFTQSGISFLVIM